MLSTCGRWSDLPLINQSKEVTKLVDADLLTLIIIVLDAELELESCGLLHFVVDGFVKELADEGRLAAAFLAYEDQLLIRAFLRCAVRQPLAYQTASAYGVQRSP